MIGFGVQLVHFSSFKNACGNRLGVFGHGGGYPPAKKILFSMRTPRFYDTDSACKKNGIAKRDSYGGESGRLPEGSPFRAQGEKNSQSNFNSHYFGAENSTKGNVYVSAMHLSALLLCSTHPSISIGS